MRGLLILSKMAEFIYNNLELASLNGEYQEVFDLEIKKARLRLIEAAHHISYAYSWSISKGSHESSLPSIPGESVASEQPVYGES